MADLSDFPCYVCNRSEYSLLPFGYTFRNRELRGVKCKNCGLVFIHPQPSDEEIKSLYDEEYFTSLDPTLRPHGRSDYFTSVESEKENRIYQERLKNFLKYTKKGNLLEIGCGPGHFLNIAKTDGWDALGIEISPFAAEFAREHFQLDVFTGTIEELTLPDHSFNVIFMGDLLEHVRNPKTLLIRIRELLAMDGILYAEVPSITNGLYSRCGTAVLRILGKKKFINLPPYHLFEFNPNNISNLLKIAGFAPVIMRQNTVSPRDVGLHDTTIANLLKIGLQSLNFAVTRITGSLGDRLRVVAKPS